MTHASSQAVPQDITAADVDGPQSGPKAARVHALIMARCAMDSGRDYLQHRAALRAEILDRDSPLPDLLVTDTQVHERVMRDAAITGRPYLECLAGVRAQQREVRLRKPAPPAKTTTNITLAVPPTPAAKLQRSTGTRPVPARPAKPASPDEIAKVFVSAMREMYTTEKAKRPAVAQKLAALAKGTRLAGIANRLSTSRCSDDDLDTFTIAFAHTTGAYLHDVLHACGVTGSPDTYRRVMQRSRFTSIDDGPEAA
jgi:hypothetical protein